MNTEDLIDRLHEEAARRRQAERGAAPTHRRLWVPAAVAAAVLLAIVLPIGHRAEAKQPVARGIYCNSQCSPDEVMALLEENINHIRQTQQAI